jgi:hypothetical protein
MIHMHEVSERYHGATPEPETKTLRASHLLGLGAFPVTEDGSIPFAQIPSNYPMSCRWRRTDSPVPIG